jgi:preprotein translocase subunit SecD
MRYRPKTWIVLLALLFVFAFEIGFQPLRFIHAEKGARTATYDYALGKVAAPDEEGLSEKLADVRQKLEEAELGEKQIEEMRFIDPSTLRVATLVLTDEQQQQDRQTVIDVLKEDYPKVEATEVEMQTEEEVPVARLGPLGIFTPIPHVQLGLDLQGGAHVVLQAMPSTEMTFASPEDKPMVEGEQGAEEASPEEEGPEEAEEAKTEEAEATESGEGEEAAESSEPEAPETGAKETSEAAAETNEDEEQTEGEAWQPGETAESLREKLLAYCESQGMADADIDVVSPSRVLVYTQATEQSEAEKQRETILSWLQAKYRGVNIEAPEPNSVFVEAETAEKAKHIIDLRLFSMSDVKEPLVQVQGRDRIIVELPGVKDPNRVTKILRSTARLEFRLVPERYEPKTPETDDYTMWKDSQGGPNATVTEEAVLAESEVVFTGRDLKANAQVQSGQGTDWEVRFELKESRKQAFAEFTRDNVGHIMAIVLDRETKMAPVIRSEIMGVGVISGNMTTEEASDLKLLLNAGALPVPLSIVENRQVSATLGADSIRQSLTAGITGIICVMVFMVLYYRLPGLLADIALILYVLAVLAVLSTWSPLQATLTLPGIAGIILSIGMAVDANIIIFERLKEELRTRTTTRAAAEAGFTRAWTAILDANVTTLIVAAALYFLGTSAVKSFAVTLFVGVCVSLFTAVTVSRWLVFMAARSRMGENRWWFGVGPAAASASTAPGGSE